MLGRTAEDCDGAVKAEAPVARRAADVKRVDRGAIVLFKLVGYLTRRRSKDREEGRGRRSSKREEGVGVFALLKRSG